MAHPQPVDDGYERPLLALVSQNVRQMMSAHGESQAAVGSVLGMSQAQVSERLRGMTPWTFRDVAKLAVHWELEHPSVLMGPTSELPWDRLDPTERFRQPTVKARPRKRKKLPRVDSNHQPAGPRRVSVAA